jgi:hypothetical protein
MEAFMSAKTKIVVLHMKKLIFTGIVSGLIILVIIFLFTLMHFRTENTEENEVEPTLYVPGVYTSSVMIDEKSLEVDRDHVPSCAAEPGGAFGADTLFSVRRKYYIFKKQPVHLQTPS